MTPTHGEEKFVALVHVSSQPCPSSLVISSFDFPLLPVCSIRAGQAKQPGRKEGKKEGKGREKLPQLQAVEVLGGSRALRGRARLRSSLVFRHEKDQTMVKKSGVNLVWNQNVVDMKIRILLRLYYSAHEQRALLPSLLLHGSLGVSTYISNALDGVICRLRSYIGRQEIVFSSYSSSIFFPASVHPASKANSGRQSSMIDQSHSSVFGAPLGISGNQASIRMPIQGSSVQQTALAAPTTGLPCRLLANSQATSCVQAAASSTDSKASGRKKLQ